MTEKDKGLLQGDWTTNQTLVHHEGVGQPPAQMDPLDYLRKVIREEPQNEKQWREEFARVLERPELLTLPLDEI